MKVTNSTEKITPFGGFNFVFNSFKNSGLPELIDNQLGVRALRGGFSYSDIFANHMAIFFNGGDCTEDINVHLRDALEQVPSFSVCSADTILRGIKELAVDTELFINPSSGVSHEFNINGKLNSLLLKSACKTGLLKSGVAYDLDYDNTVIPTEKYDSKKTYKHVYGYQPGVASIAHPEFSQAIPVYVEGRNGNSQAKYLQADTLTRMFGQLTNENIRIGRFRADSASYQEEVLRTLEAHTESFYIRANRCAKLDNILGSIAPEKWQKIRLGVQEMEVTDLSDYKPFGKDRSYRLVITRIRRKDGQADVFSGDAFTYRAILTNEHTSSNEAVVRFYNARGASERLFDVLNNDFGWSKLPCSFLAENTSFMLMTAMYANFYTYIIGEYSRKVDWLKPTDRLKKFIFRFITVSAKWIRTGRREVLKLFTSKDYKPILN